MKAYRVEQGLWGINYVTSDFMDVWNELEKPREGICYKITPLEMTVTEYNEIIKLNKNGPKKAD